MGQLLHIPIVLFNGFFVALGQPSNGTQRTYELIEAVQRVSYKEVKQLLQSGVDVKVRRTDGSTALSWAGTKT